MEIQKTMSAYDVDQIVNSWIYKSINDYLSSNDFVTASYLHGHPQCCEDPMYMHIRLFMLDEDTSCEDDDSNIIIKNMFNSLIKNADKIKQIQNELEEYNSEIRHMLCSIDFNLSTNYEYAVTIDSYLKVKDIVESDIEIALNTIKNLQDYSDDECYIFDGRCDLNELTRALSYSILIDFRWHNYFNLIAR